MKTILLLLLVASTTFAGIAPGPLYILNRKMGQAATEAKLGKLIEEGGTYNLSKDGVQPKKLVQATYDVAVEGGGTGTHELGISIPDNAIITRAFLDVLTRPSQASGAAGASLAVTINSSGDVLAAKHAGTFSSGSLLEGLQTGGTSAMVKTTAVRPLKVEVTNAALTAGKVLVYLEYVVSE